MDKNQPTNPTPNEPVSVPATPPQKSWFKNWLVAVEGLILLILLGTTGYLIKQNGQLEKQKEEQSWIIGHIPKFQQTLIKNCKEIIKNATPFIDHKYYLSQ